LPTLGILRQIQSGASLIAHFASTVKQAAKALIMIYGDGFASLATKHGLKTMNIG
jgi:hypothetical protein